jgi:hypothetical protein
MTDLHLAVDCIASGCNGERTFAIAELASFHGRDATVGAGATPPRAAQRPVAAAETRPGWIRTRSSMLGYDPRRAPLPGPDARE